MTDINLFNRSGFQEGASKNIRGQGQESLGKSRRFSLSELVAVLVAIALGLLVWWFFSLTSSVKSEVKEYTPEEFMMKSRS